MTRPLSEPYYRRHRQPPSSCSGKLIFTSPSTNELRTSSGERSLHQRHRDASRTSNPTSAGRRGLVKRTSRRRMHARRHPRRPVSVPQGHAPHPPELQGFQAFRRARSTLPTSTSSPAARRARRTATALAAGGGRRWSLLAR
jgi:hypothetical protein